MMSDKDNLGLDIRSKLEGMKVSPDQELWDKIETTLIEKKRKKRLFFFFILSGILIIGSMIFLLNQNNLTNKIDKTQPSQDINAIGNTERTINEDSKSIKSQSIESSIGLNEKPLVHTKPLQTSNRTSDGLEKNTKYNDNYIEDENEVSIIINQDDEDEIELSSVSYKEELGETAIKDSILNAKKENDNKVSDKEKTLDSTTSKIQDSRWSISPHLIGSYYGSFNSSVSNNYDLNYGLLFIYRANEKLYLRTGLRYFNLNQTVNNFDQASEYFQIPIEVKYVPFSKNINPYFIGGMSYFNLIESNYNEEYKSTFGVDIGAGAETSIVQQLYLNVELNFYYQIRPFSSDSAINTFFLTLI